MNKEIPTNGLSKIREIDVPGVNVKEFTHLNGDCRLEIILNETSKVLPVYNIRNDSNKESIAKALVSGKPVAAFGVGNYGLAVGIDNPRRERFPDSWKEFWKFKPVRPHDAHIPILLPPKYWNSIVDFDKIHQGFKGLFTREKLKKLYYDAVIFHIVAPTYDFAPHINIPALITDENGTKSVSAFWWDDPDMEEIADLAIRLDPFMLIGISSFNDHGENPAFNYEEVIGYVLKKKKIPFDFIVRDPIGESVEVKSSHPQFKVPEKGEKPVWKVVRRGSRSVNKFLNATGLQFEAEGENSAPYAPRAHSAETNLDNLVDLVHDLTLKDFSRRRAA